QRSGGGGRADDRAAARAGTARASVGAVVLAGLGVGARLRIRGGRGRFSRSARCRGTARYPPTALRLSLPRRHAPIRGAALDVALGLAARRARLAFLRARYAALDRRRSARHDG